MSASPQLIIRIGGPILSMRKKVSRASGSVSTYKKNIGGLIGTAVYLLA